MVGSLQPHRGNFTKGLTKNTGFGKEETKSVFSLKEGYS